ncbi:SH3 domain-containing protein [Candidatus Dojkabacteria bacterium]|uniref:SH3 domain-containing protein n=1 Tax=Candidatus Dojkabacteria bacterium TaxID=2099670 RepID=A0A955RKH1_9BACT|nr:SH3 domain-containing protein [Candidatus Dojkabacteria bacterium]
MWKKFFVYNILFFIGVFILSFHTVHAQYVTLTEEEISVEGLPTGELTEFATPDSLIVVPIVPPKVVDTVDPYELYRGMYYYQVSRYGMPAIGFHYVITEDGQLIENTFSHADRPIQVENDIGEHPILVGYMTTSGSLGFKSSSKSKVANILIDVINKNAIPLEQVFVRSLSYQETSDRQLQLQSNDIFIGWENDLANIIESVAGQYSPVERIYSVTVKEVIVPNTEQEIGSEFDVSLTIENTGDFPVYSNSDGELIFSYAGNNNASGYFINERWDTPTQVKIMQEGDILLPGEEKEFVLPFLVPFSFGQVSEPFTITNVVGNDFLPQPLEIGVSVQRPEGEFIEITDTETGYLNVRSAPSIGGDEVTRVSPGDRFEVLGRENGWVNIQLSESETGWVLGKYTRNL